MLKSVGQILISSSHGYAKHRQLDKRDANFPKLMSLSNMGVVVAIKSNMNNEAHKKLE